MKLYKGNIVIAERASETSLFSPEIRSIKATGFDQRWCSNAAKVRGLPFEILAKRDTAMEKFMKNSGAKAVQEEGSGPTSEERGSERGRPPSRRLPVAR